MLIFIERWANRAYSSLYSPDELRFPPWRLTTYPVRVVLVDKIENPTTAQLFEPVDTSDYTVKVGIGQGHPDAEIARVTLPDSFDDAGLLGRSGTLDLRTEETQALLVDSDPASVTLEIVVTPPDGTPQAQLAKDGKLVGPIIQNGSPPPLPIATYLTEEESDERYIAEDDASELGLSVLSAEDAEAARGLLDAAPVLRGKLVYVDSVNGSDTTGSRGTRRPFLTLAAAKAAAQSGDTIVVGPGVYTVTSSIAKDGVHWHLNPGTTITSAGPQIFDDGGSAMSYSVRGHGRLVMDHPDDEGEHLIVVRHASSSVVIEVDELYGNSLGLVWLSTGSLHLRARRVENPTGGAVECNGGSGEFEVVTTIAGGGGGFAFVGGTHIVRAGKIYGPSAGSEGVSISSGEASVHAELIDGGAGEAVNFGGGTLRVYNARLLANSATCPVRLFGTSAGRLELINCSVRNTAAGEPSILFQPSTANKSLVLRNVDIIAESTAAESIHASDAQSVTVYGGVANKAVDSDITQLVGALIVDAAVQ